MDAQLKLDRIEQLAGSLSIAKYNLLKINYLNKMVAETDLHAEQCETCHANSKLLSEMIEQIPQLDNIDVRQPYERNFNIIRKHFHTVHGFIPPHFYSSRYSVAGIAIGLMLSAMVSWLLHNRIVSDMLLAGFVIGLAIGYLIGSLKEKKYIRKKKII